MELSATLSARHALLDCAWTCRGQSPTPRLDKQMAFDHAAETRENESRGREKNDTGVTVWLQNLAHRSQTAARTAIVTDK
jgi:hypothetical protein